MEGTPTPPKEVTILLNAVFQVVIEEGDVETFQFMVNLVEETISLAHQSMAGAVRMN